MAQESDDDEDDDDDDDDEELVNDDENADADADVIIIHENESKVNLLGFVLDQCQNDILEEKERKKALEKRKRCQTLGGTIKWSR